MNYYKAFALNDLKNVRRDTLLFFILLAPWLIVATLRWGLPPLGEWLLSSYEFLLDPYLPLILSFFIILQVPFLFGVVFGLLILDEKDDRVLMILQVTPATLQGYIRYRIISVIIFSLLYIMLILTASGFIDYCYLPGFIPIAVLGGTFAALSLFFLIAFANNKIEGLAIMKGMGILMLGPLAAYFVDSQWQLLLGVLPSYWPAKAFWMISEGRNGWIYILIGLIYNVVLTSFLLSRFKRKAGISI